MNLKIVFKSELDGRDHYDIEVDGVALPNKIFYVHKLRDAYGTCKQEFDKMVENAKLNPPRQEIKDSVEI